MKVYAHRGASGCQPENTISAFLAAVEQGATAVELDIHLVEDTLYVFHDRRLEAKSSGKGLISQASKTYLQSLSVSGEPIPTLVDVLKALKPYHVEVNIELKGLSVLPAFIALYNTCSNEQLYPVELMLISSFNHPQLKAFKQHFPHAKVAPLIEGVPLDLARIVTVLNADAIHLGLSFINEDMIKDAHQRGAKVNVYTVDCIDDVIMLKALGVDGVFTNYPERILTCLA